MRPRRLFGLYFSFATRSSSGKIAMPFSRALCANSAGTLAKTETLGELKILWLAGLRHFKFCNAKID